MTHWNRFISFLSKIIRMASVQQKDTMRNLKWNNYPIDTNRNLSLKHSKCAFDAVDFSSSFDEK